MREIPGYGARLGSITRQGMIYALAGAALELREKEIIYRCAAVFMQISNSPRASPGAARMYSAVYSRASMPLCRVCGRYVDARDNTRAHALKNN